MFWNRKKIIQQDNKATHNNKNNNIYNVLIKTKKTPAFNF